MARVLVRVFDAILVLSAVMSMAMPLSLAQVIPLPWCPAGVANFGDSLTDTGNAADAFPFALASDFPPYGETFFGKPAKRFSNGRLVPDFFSQAFGWPLLDAYFSVASFNFQFGVNFANAGSDAAFTATALEPFALTPFQTAQFIRFQNSVFGTLAQPGCSNFFEDLPLLNPFPNWLYTITAGSNDLLTPFINGASISFVNTTIVPQAVGAIIVAIKTLYGTGARRFLVYGIPAGGCSPVVLTFLENQIPPPQKDNLGCIVALNSVSQNFNTQLLLQIKLLRQSLLNVSIAFFDYYGANIAMLSNPTAFGFDPTKTTTACCGAGNGTYNYNPAVPCGSAGSNNCANPDKYFNWDGIHFTEAFYRYIATFALNGNYTDGGINYKKSCVLDFSKFPSGVTFKQAYPLQTCNNLYT